MASKVYTETFDDGPNGWVADLRSELPVWDGVAHCFSPWSLDANHAPPGAGYLHLLMYLPTHAKMQDGPTEANGFLRGGFGRDMTDAELTVRLRGRLGLTGLLCNYVEPPKEACDVQLVLLVQGHVPKVPPGAGTTANFVLTGQPFTVTEDWSEQTVRLTPDPDQWTCLGARHDLGHQYGYAPIADVLADVNVDIIFVLFPLTVVPLGDVADRDRLWAAKDYKVDMQHLPKGLVQFDTVQIRYPG